MSEFLIHVAFADVDTFLLLVGMRFAIDVGYDTELFHWL